MCIIVKIPLNIVHYAYLTNLIKFSHFSRGMKMEGIKTIVSRRVG